MMDGAWVAEVSVLPVELAWKGGFCMEPLPGTVIIIHQRMSHTLVASRYGLQLKYHYILLNLCMYMYIVYIYILN